MKSSLGKGRGRGKGKREGEKGREKGKEKREGEMKRGNGSGKRSEAKQKRPVFDACFNFLSSPYALDAARCDRKSDHFLLIWNIPGRRYVYANVYIHNGYVCTR